MRFDGRVVVLTGGAKGIGAVTAEAFADERARVAALDLDGAGIDKVVAAVSARGGEIVGLKADATSAKDIQSALDIVLGRWGRIDVLVNNAGAPGSLDKTPVVDLPEDQWDTVLDTNLKGTFITSQAVARTMLAGRVRGRIISMSSQWGKKGGALRAAYCASKFGIIGFTQSLAQELAPAGITVNAICPSAAETERLDHMGLRPDGSYDQKQREERIKNVAAGTPLGRIARPSDVAEVAAFLAGDAAEYITGQSINVTGGGVMH